MKMNILALGDIVGRPGREILKDKLPYLLKKLNVDFCVVNAENAAGGSGITPVIMNELLSYGINVLTTGDHIWKKKEIIPAIEKESRLLRPANYAPQAAGKGYGIFEAQNGVTVGVVNLQGRVFMPPSDCPFHAVDKIIKLIANETKIIVVDFHGEATSEKIALGRYLDGRVSIVFGTHTHVPTADEYILPKGTAYITDVGMTGPYESVLGRAIEKVVATFTSQMPHTFDVAKDDVRISGLLVKVNTDTGQALKVERIHIKAD